MEEFVTCPICDSTAALVLWGFKRITHDHCGWRNAGRGVFGLWSPMSILVKRQRALQISQHCIQFKGFTYFQNAESCLGVNSTGTHYVCYRVTNWCVSKCVLQKLMLWKKKLPLRQLNPQEIALRKQSYTQFHPSRQNTYFPVGRSACCKNLISNEGKEQKHWNFRILLKVLNWEDLCSDLHSKRKFPSS